MDRSAPVFISIIIGVIAVFVPIPAKKHLSPEKTITQPVAPAPTTGLPRNVLPVHDDSASRMA